ncbi:hypothetical protein BKA62DRAFT_656217 [Auriculariales sp. MPI-PUGE-AT-0066]|nr:hypothetical protein BKA62DRAFT_656217 [Auriculariales sp. MPI-PUGE-AT-0066]
MSDAFSNLWQTTSSPNSSQQSIGQQQKQTLAAQGSSPSPPPWAAKASKSDAFSILAASSTSATPLRSNTPSRSPAPQTAAAVPRSSGDAFSGLVAFGGAPRSTNGSTISIGAQQARAVTPLLGQQQYNQPVAAQNNALWDQLDSLGASSKPAASTPVTTSDPDPWDFLSAAPSHPVPVSASVPAQNTRATSSSGNVFDLLDDFGAAPTTSDSTGNSFKSSASGAAMRSVTPNSLQVSEPAATSSFNAVASDDDFWDTLNKPATVAPPRVSPAVTERNLSSRSSPAPRQAPGSRRGSPPPHLIGQIVEMGFSIQQARAALAATPTGDDVQAALETLLQGAPADDTAQDVVESDSEDERQRQRARRHEQRRRGPNRETPNDPHHAPTQTTNTMSQIQADKILQQASSFGLSVFSKASAMFNEGKEYVQKTYGEQGVTPGRASSSNTSRQAKPTRDRPVWMPEDGDAEQSSPVKPSHESGFKDSSDNEAPSQPVLHRPPAVNHPKQSRIAADIAAQPAQPPHKFIFHDTQPPVQYASPGRRGPVQTFASSSTAATQAPDRRPSPNGPVPPPPPTMPSASSSTLLNVAQHKTKANEAFKLGTYPVAVTSYSSAMEALPDGHMARIPLLTNRALASLRIGEWRGALEDCTSAISMIRPNTSGPVYLGAVSGGGKNLEGETLYLGDALLKALSRRAMAREMGEKWPEALADWEEVGRAATLPMSAAPSADVGKVRAEATRGTERCRKMIGIVKIGAAESVSLAAPTTKPRPPPRKTNPMAELAAEPSEAVKRVRDANSAAEKEEAEKAALKDSVDARLVAWRSGKENNIRALLASLDSVLWPELQWQTVGMAELIDPNRLKTRYTKAIAKLHPDKLSISKTTVEQRMIANGVFSTLNDAWSAAKI